MQHLTASAENVAAADARPSQLELSSSAPVTEEAAPRAPEDSYHAIFLHASDGIWVHDLETGEALDVNFEAARLFGYTREEMLALPHSALIFPRTEYTAERVAEYLARAAAGETPRFEWLGMHRDGREVWCELTLRRVRMGGVDRVVASARDISKRRAAERELQRANAELELRVAERTGELRESEEHFRALIENTAIERLRNSGADHYLTKPIDLDEFFATLERYLG